MNEKATQRDSFVVRIWHDEGRFRWLGWVQHVRTGEEARLDNLDDLLAFIESRAGLRPKSNTADTHLK